MAARLFGQVSVETPVVMAANWWNTTDTTELLAALHPVRPRSLGTPTRTIVVTFGDLVPQGDFGIGGDDYTVRVGCEPQPLGPFPAHAFGVHAASCLAVSRLLLEVLGPHGFPGVPVVESYVMNLVDYQLTPAPGRPPATTPMPGPLRLAVAGVGSVGSSALALLANALHSNPALSPVEIVAIDADVIDPDRNPFRYPSLLGGENGSKAEHFATRLAELGLAAKAVDGTVADWVRDQDEPGFDGLLVSSVDTIAGRLDVTDALARSTLSIGVSGLALHAQREGFGDGFACPFCDYVSAAPPSTQAGEYAEATGLPVERVLALLAILSTGRGLAYWSGVSAGGHRGDHLRSPAAARPAHPLGHAAHAGLSVRRRGRRGRGPFYMAGSCCPTAADPWAAGDAGLHRGVLCRGGTVPTGSDASSCVIRPLDTRWPGGPGSSVRVAGADHVKWLAGARRGTC